MHTLRDLNIFELLYQFTLISATFKLTPNCYTTRQRHLVMLVEKNHAPSLITKVHSYKILASETTVSRGAKFSNLQH